MSQIDGHDHTPHVYIVWWARYGMMKIGLSTKARWEKWHSTGAVDIATIETCCKNHAHKIEHDLHGVMRKTGFQAFVNDGMDKFRILGAGGAGHSECQLMVWDDAWGEIPSSPYDYARAYGLPLTDELRAAIQVYNPAWHPVEDFDEMVAKRVATRRDCQQCDNYGWVLDPDPESQRPIAKCTHPDPLAPARGW